MATTIMSHSCILVHILGWGPDEAPMCVCSSNGDIGLACAPLPSNVGSGLQRAWEGTDIFCRAVQFLYASAEWLAAFSYNEPCCAMHIMFSHGEAEHSSGL